MQMSRTPPSPPALLVPPSAEIGSAEIGSAEGRAADGKGRAADCKGGTMVALPIARVAAPPSFI